MRGKDKREALFRLYSDNFRRVCESQGWSIGYEINGKVCKIQELIYVCPICFQFFQKNDLNQKEKNPLTLEDAPPKALGGKPVILTCKFCNNYSGTNLDSHLKMDFDLSLFSKGISETNAKIKIKVENPFKSTISFSPERKQLTVIYNRKNDYAKKQIEKLAAIWDGSEFSFTVIAPNKRKFSIGLLRIAYLLAFAKFGYSYVLSEGGKIIRTQILTPFDDIVGLNFVTHIDFFEGQKDVFIIRSSPNTQFLLVVFLLEKKSINRYFGIILPGPNKEDVASYINFDKKRNLDFKFAKVPKSNYLHDALGYHKLWQDMKQKD